MALTAAERVARAAWWKRDFWPAVILGVDPGATAGRAIAVPKLGRWAEEKDGGRVVGVRAVETASRGLEESIREAAHHARELGKACGQRVELLLVMESWGSGGKLGINTWLGLGAAAGAWERAFRLLADEEIADVVTPTRCMVKVQQSTWRSYMHERWGVGEGKQYRPFKSEEWKEEALRRVQALMPYARALGPDATEAALIAAYAARSDEVGQLLPASYLGNFGREPVPKKAKG